MFNWVSTCKPNAMWTPQHKAQNCWLKRMLLQQVLTSMLNWLRSFQPDSNTGMHCSLIDLVPKELYVCIACMLQGCPTAARQLLCNVTSGLLDNPGISSVQCMPHLIRWHHVLQVWPSCQLPLCHEPVDDESSLFPAC